MNDNKILPRRDLREPAFRRYELYISRACEHSISIDPRELKLSQATFAARTRDAILSKIRYNYPSDLIPPTFNLANLEVLELSDGRVLIQNKTKNEIPTMIVNETTEQDVINIMKQVATKKITNYEMAVVSPDELTKILQWAEQHPDIDCLVVPQNGKAFFYTL